MIRNDEIIPVGTFVKPHGIKGEITCRIDRDVDLGTLRCLVVDIDGIYVPFFVDSYRPRSTESVLIKLSDIDDEYKAQALCGKEIFALVSDIPEAENDAVSDGFYLSDFIGYTLLDDSGRKIGVVDDFDDSTENVLLIVKSGESKIYIPVVEEFILSIDATDRIITMRLPEGLIDLN